MKTYRKVLMATAVIAVSLFSMNCSSTKKHNDDQAMNTAQVAPATVSAAPVNLGASSSGMGR